MKLICDREKLWQAFQLAAAVVPRRSPKPVLENVKFEVTKTTGTLLATDMEVGVRIDVTGLEVSVPGEVLLPVKQVGPILRETTDDRLKLESDGTKLAISSSQSEFQLPTQNPDEYPAVRAFTGEIHHEVSARFLREMFRRTAYASDTESSRYALGGVLLEMSDERIVAVATDGRRLAKQEGPAKSIGGHKTTDTSIVPTGAVQLIERALGDTEESVLLAICDNDVTVKTQRGTIYARLLEGRFPKWRDVIPQTSDLVRVDMAVGPMAAAVRQSAVVTSTEHRGVEFRFSQGKLILSGHGAELGESHVELPIAYDGEDIPVKLDPRYVIEYLATLDLDSSFAVYIRDALSAVLCCTEDGYQYVIMPLSRDT